ncbi:hypothetical protein TKK_0009444 [Trichogramma kaykai]|uniref:Uncharacterized protein n=1 Tax=Trichogramma kaykai TaxID=54128 RepID=A0ABD2WYZ4_9HYME
MQDSTEHREEGPVIYPILARRPDKTIMRDLRDIRKHQEEDEHLQRLRNTADQKVVKNDKGIYQYRTRDVNVVAARSNVCITIEYVDSAETLIIPSTSRRRRYDQQDEANMTVAEINAKRARILGWNQEVLAAARRITADEEKEPRLAALAKLPDAVELQRETTTTTWNVPAPSPSIITISDDYSLVSDKSLTDYIVADIKRRIAAELKKQRRRRTHTKSAGEPDSGSTRHTDDELGYTSNSGYCGKSLND